MKKEIPQYLIERSLAGDAEAFGEIYFRLKDSIYGFSRRMTGEIPIAEEITQEVFVFFIENPDKFDSSRGSLFSFLCGVARNKILNYLKKSGTRLEEDNFKSDFLENTVNGNGKSPVQNILDKELSAELEKCFENLVPYQKEVLFLREIEELSYEEIAAITKTNIGIVKSRIYRARKTLAANITPYLESQKETVYEVRK